MAQKIKVQQLDDDKVLHFILENKVFADRMDCEFLDLDNDLNHINGNEVNIIFLNSSIMLENNLLNQQSLKRKFPKAEIILVVNSKKEIEDNPTIQKDFLLIDRENITIPNLKNNLEEAIYRHYQKNKNPLN